MRVMADSLQDLLKSRLPSEPPEFAVIKDFVQGRYKVTPKLHVSGAAIVISVPGAALAGSLRMDLYELQKITNTKYKLAIRIS